MQGVAQEVGIRRLVQNILDHQHALDSSVFLSYSETIAMTLNDNCNDSTQFRTFCDSAFGEV